MSNVSHRKILVSLAMIAALSLADMARAAPAGAARPNIVLILVDDVGYSDVGCFGSEISTPHIDALAKGGVAWTQFYNQARCCPTRAALMTGRYPHQVGVGEMIDEYAKWARDVASSPAYQDHLSPSAPTIAERLRAAGYSTMMVGKWHLGKRPEEWPVRRGFDRSFVQVNGAMNFWGGLSTGPRDLMAMDDQIYTPPIEGFFTTDAFTDHGIQFVDEAVKQGKDKPFFLYMAYNASHWPLHASEKSIAEYKGKYDAGWQATRTARLKRMKELGIVDKAQTMAPMDHGKSKPWNELKPDERKEWSRRMEVFAAQTSDLDRGIGRLVDHLKKVGVDRNTLVLFLSDNGGAAEDPNRGNKKVPIGHRESYRGYGVPWATVSNTPWRLHKVSAYEGGISTPLIVSWPAGIPAERRGTLIREPGHIIDLVPTFLEFAGASPKKEANDSLEGQSLAPALASGPGQADRTLCWEHEGNRAIRKGKWKLVALKGAETWELFDISVDRIEGRNLAKQHPDVVRDLTAEYDRWAKRCGVIPYSELLAKKPPSTGPAPKH